jgi:hypothetical protein
MTRHGPPLRPPERRPLAQRDPDSAPLAGADATAPTDLSARVFSPRELAEARRREPFRNAREAGFPEDLLRRLGEALDAHGADQKHRFVTFARTPDAPLHASESRLCGSLVRAGREHAARVGVWAVYVPRGQRAASAEVMDPLGIHWLHATGFASRTIMDLYGVSATRLFAILRGQPRPHRKVRQIRDARGHAEAHAAGHAWLARHQPEALPEGTAGPDHARVARCGHALLQFRQHFGRDPRRPSGRSPTDEPGPSAPDGRTEPRAPEVPTASGPTRRTKA